MNAFHPILWWAARTRWQRVALLVWCLVLAFVCTRVWLRPTERTVYPIFSGSAQLWWQGQDLYAPDRPNTVQAGYRYSPAFAALIMPLALLPDAVGGAIWRLINVAAFLAALAWFAKVVLPWQLSRDEFAWLTLLCLPLSVQSINNGQANMLVITTMLAAVAAAKQQHWNLASACITVAFLCKVYPLALGLLLVLLYPQQLGLRMAAAMAVGLLVPFALQHPNYVVDQYDAWLTLLRADDRTYIGVESKYRDLWLLTQLYDLHMDRLTYSALQALAGMVIAFLCWRRQQDGWSQRSLLTSTLALAVAWMVVLGPGIESSTFMLLAPSLACSIITVLCWHIRDRRTLLLATSVGLFFLAAGLGSLGNTAKMHVIGLHSWASLCYFIYLLIERPKPAALYNATDGLVSFRVQENSVKRVKVRR